MTDVVPEIASRFEPWLLDGRIHAELMLSHSPSYADCMRALRFYFARKALEISHGKYVQMASMLGISSAVGHRLVSPATWTMDLSCQRQAEAWASSLAIQRLRYREALFVWSRCLLLEAINRSNGNHLAASRALKVHRNVMWRIPSSPAQTSCARIVGQARGAA